MNYALQLSKVCKKYEASGFALDHVSFALPMGCIMGFVGENGAGKTTTIGCILNTLSRDSGSVRLFEKEMDDRDTALRSELGVVYDGDNFPGYISAGQLSDIMQGIYPRWDRPLFDRYLQDFHLDEKKKIGRYSKGMTMKLALAAALAHHPRLLILDEATGGLDPVARDEMSEIFLDFVGQPDHSILLSSHDTAELEKIADYITFIHQGKIILTAPKDDLLYNYAILRCREKDFARLEKEDILAYRRQDYQIDVLVNNKKAIVRKYGDIVADSATIDEIMLLLVKGERK